MTYKKIGILGPIFYYISIFYSILYYGILFLNKFSPLKEIIFINKAIIALDIIFIGIHFIILFFIVFIFAVTLMAVFIGKNFIKNKKQKIQTETSIKSIKYRILIPILYAFLPIPMYIYYLTKLKILIPFASYPIWFLFLYKYIEKKIENYEIEIGSPMVKYHDRRMF